MDSETGQQREQILKTLVNKAMLKQRVSDNTFLTFELLKETLHEIVAEMDEDLEDKIDKRIRIDYRDRGKYEAQVQVAEDILIFSMHTDIFRFHDEHAIWDNEYTKSNTDNAYCGIINIYNFLADSFKFNRATDEGYLIGRIFVNHEKFFFVEGKFPTPVNANEFGKLRLDSVEMSKILESAINYAINFDLFVPPYEESKIATVEQFNTRTENSKFQTGKRIGFEFNCDDI